MYMLSLGGKAEPAIRRSKTILHNALNGQTASNNHLYFMSHLLNVHVQHHKCKYACTLLIDGLGHLM